MKKLLLCIALLVLIVSCTKKAEDATPTNPHVANAQCSNCHTVEQTQWASSLNLHAQSATDVLTNADHNTAELLTDDCLKCHSTFQFKSGVAHFVTPIDQAGSPTATWSVKNAGDWKATNCEVCHDPTATNTAKLAKYGSLLDGPWNARYIKISELPDAYQKVLSSTTGVISTYIYPDQTKLAVQATKLCLSCHDPADQGGDPDMIVSGINQGPQGGDSRSYVADHHQGFNCTDCHLPHSFEPVDPTTTTACMACHTKSITGNVKVHINHI